MTSLGDVPGPQRPDTPADPRPANTRAALLLQGATAATAILEIGPSYGPAAPRAAGWQTHVVDHTTQAELREKYAAAGVDVGVIEPVDTVWTDGPLDAAVPASLHGKFDLLIASHVLEHMLDPIGLLQSAGRLMREDGILSFAVPDMRFCFDVYKPHTTTGDLLEAHANAPSRHPLRLAWNHFAYAAALGGRSAWAEPPETSPELVNPFETNELVARIYGTETGYLDMHAWMFTPASFALTILELNALGLIDWQIDGLDGPIGFEFFARLTRSRGAGSDDLQERRLALLQALRTELSEVTPDFVRLRRRAEAGEAAREALSVELAGVRSEAEMLSGELAAARSEVEMLRRDVAELAELRAEADLLRRDAAELQRDAAELRRLLQLIRGSLSWRLTRPLRALRGRPDP